jgi:hypothetical protein
MTVTETVYEAVLQRAARGELPPETCDPYALFNACGGDGYRALEAAVAVERARAAVAPRFVAARAALRAAA